MKKDKGTAGVPTLNPNLKEKAWNAQSPVRHALTIASAVCCYKKEDINAMPFMSVYIPI